MKIIVYTTNLGGYDELYSPPKWEHIVQPEYLYYTDGEAPDGWIKIPMPKGNRKDSRYYKINSHLLPPHDVSIYIDACYKIKKPLNQLVNFVEETDIAICPHHHRTFRRHAEMCIELGLDDKETIQKQIIKYGDLQVPLTENSLIIRKNNAIIKELNELWWREYLEGSQRDQLSLPYALEQVKPKLTILPFSARDNKYLHGWHQHRHNKIV
jgi:hypothetical protein